MMISIHTGFCDWLKMRPKRQMCDTRHRSVVATVGRKVGSTGRGSLTPVRRGCDTS